jgi:ABC-2 type transport system permease protein
MSALRGYAGAAAATVKRDAAVFVSYRTRFVTQMLAMLLTMTMFYYVSKLVRPGVVGPHGRYFAYVVVGIVAMAVLTAALNTAQLVRMELLAGTFERMVISPVGPVAGVVALALFPVLYSIGLAGVMLVLAAAIFGFPIHLGGVPSALGVSAVAALAFTCIGLLFAAGVLAFKSAMGATWVIAAFSILGGIYFPLRLIPGWIRWFSDVQPFTPAVDLLRHQLLGTASVQPVAVELAKLAGFCAVLMPLAVTVLWLAVNASRRRGTLIEY